MPGHHQCAAYTGLRDVGQLVADFCDGKLTGDIASRHPQHLAVSETTQGLHGGFQIFRRVELFAEQGLQARLIGWCVQHAHIEQLIEQDRIAGNLLRYPRTGSKEVDKTGQRVGIVG